MAKCMALITVSDCPPIYLLISCLMICGPKTSLQLKLRFCTREKISPVLLSPPYFRALSTSYHSLYSSRLFLRADHFHKLQTATFAPNITMLLRHRLPCLAACCIAAHAFAPVRTSPTCRLLDPSSITAIKPTVRLSTLMSDDNTVPEMTPAFPVQNKEGIYEIENQDQHT